MCLCIYTHIYMPKNKLRENSLLHIVGWVSCQISFISDNFFIWSERIYLFLSILWHSLLNSIIHPVTNWLGYIKPLQLIYVGLYILPLSPWWHIKIHQPFHILTGTCVLPGSLLVARMIVSVHKPTKWIFDLI